MEAANSSFGSAIGKQVHDHCKTKPDGNNNNDQEEHSLFLFKLRDVEYPARAISRDQN